jgi:ATP-binding cassette subfamily G (WHITE) protein 2 (SNQ2)
LETIGAGIGRGGPKDWSSVWRRSRENKKLLAQLEIQDDDVEEEKDEQDSEEEDLSQVQPIVPPDAEPIEFDRYMASTWKEQLYQVVKRAFIVYWRMPSYNFVRIVMAIFMSLVIGSAFYKEPATQKGAEVGVAAIFMGALFGILQLTSAIHPLEDERDVFYREISSGTYRPWVYWVAVTVDEIPYALLSGTIFTVFFYFLVGFPGSRFGQFYLAFVLFMLTAISIGQCIAILAPNQQVSQMVAPVINSLMFVLAGFIIPKPSIPNYMIWLYWANPYSYALEALAVDILHDKKYYCTSSEYSAFPKPPGVTCSSLGYSPAPSGVTCSARNGTVFDHCCLFCQITSGDQVMTEYGLSYHMMWIDIGALAAYVIGFRLLALIGIQYVHYINR